MWKNTNCISVNISNLNKIKVWHVVVSLAIWKVIPPCFWYPYKVQLGWPFGDRQGESSAMQEVISICLSGIPSFVQDMLKVGHGWLLIWKLPHLPPGGFWYWFPQNLLIANVSHFPFLLPVVLVVFLTSSMFNIIQLFSKASTNIFIHIENTFLGWVMNRACTTFFNFCSEMNQWYTKSTKLLIV